jgi:hypothetical protein
MVLRDLWHRSCHRIHRHGHTRGSSDYIPATLMYQQQSQLRQCRVDFIFNVAQRAEVHAVWAVWGHASENPRLPESFAASKHKLFSSALLDRRCDPSQTRFPLPSSYSTPRFPTWPGPASESTRSNSPRNARQRLQSRKPRRWLVTQPGPHKDLGVSMYNRTSKNVSLSLTPCLSRY